VFRPALILLGEVKQFAPWIGESAPASALAEPTGQFSIMRSAVPQPPIAIRGDILQCERVFIWHTARYGRTLLINLNHLLRGVPYLKASGPYQNHLGLALIAPRSLHRIR
jgi:hypothetical protein